MADATPSPETNAPRTRRRRRLVPVVWIAGAAAATLLGLAVSGTLSGFTASIDNTQNTGGSGTLLMQEADGTGTVHCYSNGAGAGSAIGASNSNTCSTIDKFGADNNLVPTTSANATATTVTIKNAGTVDASGFTLAPDSACTQSANAANTGVIANGSASDFCSKINLIIKQGTATVFSGTAAQLGGDSGATTDTLNALGPVAAGTTVSFEFDIWLDSSVDNSYQGLALSLPMTWQFTQ